MGRGGYRPGSGPPKGTKYRKRGSKKDPKAAIPEGIVSESAAEHLDPLTYMLKVMNNPAADPERRDRMATIAAPYVHPKANEKGKKQEQAEQAKKASTGKFAPARPPGTLLPFPGRNNPQ